MKSIKVSDYIADFITQIGVKNVFLISGGGNMHLIDSIGAHKKVRYYCTHHEQSLVMAAEAHARITGKLAVAIVTTGPAGTNAITGVAGAWLDSTPLLILSGQVKTSNIIHRSGLRQFGVQELPIIELVKPITKYAVCVTDPKTIRYHLEKAVYIAQSGRPGPVWIDVPVDVQGAQIHQENVIDDMGVATGGSPNKRAANASTYWDEGVKGPISPTITKQLLSHLIRSKRPLLYLGNGVRVADAVEEARKLVDTLCIPVVSGWNGNDIIETDHPLYMGRPGSFGQRHANLILQNADLLLCIGTRLSVPQIGYEFDQFAPRAYKIVVDIDQHELDKPSLRNFDKKIRADAKEFIEQLLSENRRRVEDSTQKSISDVQMSVSSRPTSPTLRHGELGMQESLRLPGGGHMDSPGVAKSNWLTFCNKLKTTYPTVTHEQKNQKRFVNSYHFVDILSDLLTEKDIIITDMGTSFTCTAQSFKVKHGQRYFTSSGLASMGFGLPGAIGACIANNKKRTICISGDGGLQMNIQELQTIIHYKLPIKLFVLNNSGYLTIRETQSRFFKKKFVGSDKKSGVSLPDIVKVGKAYGFKTIQIDSHVNLKQKVNKALNLKDPVICEIIMDPEQPLIPKVTSTIDKKTGRMTSKPFEDMYPFLSRSELKKIMTPT